jgi:hypothetical protein
MLQADRGVTVRRLPDGEPQQGKQNGRVGTLLHVELPPNPATRQFSVGAPLEVESPGVLYLGEVHSYRDSMLVIAVEHTVDRAALAAIQETWRPIPDR